MPAQITIALDRVSPFTSEAAIRRHRVLIDRPSEKGGTDNGPMGGELFLASLGGCFMSNLLAAAAAREANLDGVRTQVIGTLADSPPSRFAAVELQVSAATEDRELLEKLVQIAEHGCIMVNTLKGTLDLRIRIV